jgi:cell division protein FtsB
MNFLKRLLDIKQWTYRELFIFLGAFLIMNLFAPRGFVQWVLVQQDLRRVRNEMLETNERIHALEEEISYFKSSSQIKEQKLRELGYLKPGELSLEFVSPNRKNAQREEKSTEDSIEKAR